MTVIAYISDPAVAVKILAHLGLPTRTSTQRNVVTRAKPAMR
jgi:hypothetical protein